MFDLPTQINSNSNNLPHGFLNNLRSLILSIELEIDSERRSVVVSSNDDACGLGDSFNTAAAAATIVCSEDYNVLPVAVVVTGNVGIVADVGESDGADFVVASIDAIMKIKSYSFSQRKLSLLFTGKVPYCTEHKIRPAIHVWRGESM
ncbi:Hypothetical predicted protein [Octopus vulgaris]|uniref:Uncharacterized protein n=1 Tax=Octopus vulgaris TaxID=6645 RepID=A0AA36F4M3_OCTVU|nr:Hypothetical predicted protein [Octopus vulgaris]